MTPRLHRSALPWLVLGAGLASCGAQQTASPPRTSQTAYTRVTAANDSFAGRVVHATGRLTGQTNTVAVRLQTAPRAGARPVKVKITSSSCRGRRDCLSLAGTLSGTLTAHRGLPDVGQGFAIHAAGRLAPLGKVSAQGTGAGTGNIRFGHETLKLTVKGRPGTIVLALRSAQVPGFTSP